MEIDALGLGGSDVAALAHLHDVLGNQRFDECIAFGAAMELPETVRFAREQIGLIRRAIGAGS